jgi:hypothetical protein
MEIAAAYVRSRDPEASYFHETFFRIASMRIWAPRDKSCASLMFPVTCIEFRICDMEWLMFLCAMLFDDIQDVISRKNICRTLRSDISFRPNV